MESEVPKADVISPSHKHTEKHAEHVKRKSNNGDHDHHQHNDGETHHAEHVKNGKHENKDEQPEVKKPRLSSEAAAHAHDEPPKESGDEAKEIKSNDTEKQESAKEVDQEKSETAAAPENDKHGSSEHTKAEDSKHKACAGGDTAKDAATPVKSS
ncbi:unnamed protein product [Calicophoron daubneyi]|uniref:Uncharacterized protein n=1 Tax=Calicophoron daubneyi TaxID=300641 RepID=A0AAV2T0P5_CALDB